MLENLIVGVGGLERGGSSPSTSPGVMDGRVLTSGREIQAAVRSSPPGTTFHYILNRGSRLVEADVRSVVRTVRDFERYLLEGFVTAILFLALGAFVLWLKPGVAETRLFLVFCLTWFCIPALYLDAHSTYRFSPLFLTAVALVPAVSIHLALTFPQRRGIVRRHPSVVWLPYGLSALIVPPLVGWIPPASPDWLLLVPAFATVYWGAALILLVVSLGRTSLMGATPLLRQRARVLMLGFAVGQLLPVLGTTTEAIFRVSVPHLNLLWRLNILFPLTVAYAMVRYDLFDLRAVIRTGTIYGVVTGLVALAYAGVITLLDIAFAALGVGAGPVVSAFILALIVVLLLNPIYGRTQKVVDRVFFRERRDIQRSLESLSDSMTTMRDLDGIGTLILGAIDDFFHPVRLRLLVLDPERGVYQGIGAGEALAAPTLRADSGLGRCLERGVCLSRGSGSRRARTSPRTAQARWPIWTSSGPALALPILFRGSVTGIFALGDKLSGAAYSTFDLRVLRLVANQSAVAIENARAYTALQQANTELRQALRRVEILESIRANLSKFVPATVQRLIEEAPESPSSTSGRWTSPCSSSTSRGYTRLAERLDGSRVNELVELYFGAFLDEILRHGGDVNETAGDGLMVIFRDDDPRRHARAATLTALRILERAREIDRETDRAGGPIALHVGVNSGVAAVGATKIEGKAGTRWTYTASGSVTNVAARLAALGAGEGVLIGPETRARIASGSFGGASDRGPRRAPSPQRGGARARLPLTTTDEVRVQRAPFANGPRARRADDAAGAADGSCDHRRRRTSFPSWAAVSCRAARKGSPTHPRLPPRHPPDHRIGRSPVMPASRGRVSPGCRQEGEGGDEQRGSDRAGRAEGLAEDGDAQRGRGEWLEQAHDARDGGGNALQARREERVGDGGGPEAQIEEQRRGADQIMAGCALQGEGGRQEERGEPEGDGGHGERGRSRQDALGGDRVHRIRQSRLRGRGAPRRRSARRSRRGRAGRARGARCRPPPCRAMP